MRVEMAVDGGEPAEAAEGEARQTADELMELRDLIVASPRLGVTGMGSLGPGAWPAPAI